MYRGNNRKIFCRFLSNKSSVIITCSFYGTFALYYHFKEVWNKHVSILIELLLALICDIMLTHLYNFTAMLSTHHPVIKVKIYKWSNYIEILPPYKEARDAEMKLNFLLFYPRAILVVPNVQDVLTLFQIYFNLASIEAWNWNSALLEWLETTEQCLFQHFVINLSAIRKYLLRVQGILISNF